MERNMVQDSEAELAPHPHRMQLWGEVGNLLFPRLCANCGNAASKRLTYSKTFRRVSDSDTPNSYITTLVRVPFCDHCIAQHKAEGLPASMLAHLLSRLLSAAHAVGAFGFGIAAAIAAYFAVHNLFQQHLKYSYPLALLSLFLALFAWGYYRATRDGTEHIRAQGQTGMTRAFDFSDSTAAPFESSKFVCTMKNEQFAGAFKQLNQAMEFQPGSALAQADRRRARRNFWITALFIAIFVLLSQFRK
jgi:hypothetical protein